MRLLNKSRLLICFVFSLMICVITAANATTSDSMDKKAKAAAVQKNAKEATLSGKIENGIRVIEAQAFRYGYIPDPIIVKEGEKVRLLLTSKDVMHGFGIAELGINVKIPAKKTTILEFIPKHAGTYRIYCTVYCGVGHANMNGELIVIK